MGDTVLVVDDNASVRMFMKAKLAPFNFEEAQPSPAYQRLATQARTGHDEPLLELLGLGGVNPASARY